jgi:hypothetical protein
MLRNIITIGTLGIVALFTVSIMPASAREQSVGAVPNELQALSSLPDARRVELTVMTEEELSAIEGAVFYCVICVNAAKIRAMLAANIRQTLADKIRQTLAAKIRQIHSTTIRHTHASTIRQTNVRHSSVNTHQRNSARVVQRH